MNRTTPATVVDVSDALGASGDGVHWSLGPPSDLNVNLVRLEPGHAMDEHVNRTVDVAIVVVDGSGTLSCDDVDHELHRNVVAHVPVGARRRIGAGDDGLAYLTVHRRRSLTIGARTPDPVAP